MLLRLESHFQGMIRENIGLALFPFISFHSHSIICNRSIDWTIKFPHVRKEITDNRALLPALNVCTPANNTINSNYGSRCDCRNIGRQSGIPQLIYSDLYIIISDIIPKHTLDVS